jgi:hypothetical protein
MRDKLRTRLPRDVEFPMEIQLSIENSVRLELIPRYCGGERRDRSYR